MYHHIWAKAKLSLITLAWQSELTFNVCIKSVNELLCLLVTHNALESPFSPPSPQVLEYQGIGSKKYFTGCQTANTVQLVVVVEGNFSDLFFFWTSRRKGEFPRG